MKNAVKVLVLAAALLAANAAWATPSTVMWTPATTYTQPYLVPHLTYDTYFAEAGAYPIDTGLTIGILPYDAVNAEVGVDVLYPAVGKAAFLFNGKLTLVEGKLADWQPGLSVGIGNVGLKKDVTDYNLAYGVLSKTIGAAGTVAVGGYYGLNDQLFVNVDGGKEQAGLIASYTSPDLVIDKPALNKLTFAVDVQTGKNAFGAVGAGVGVYFTPAVSLLTGPVFFLEKALQPGGASWMWSMQLDVDLDFTAKK